MSAATAQNVRDLLGGIAGVQDETINLFLNQSANVLLKQAVDISHPDYSTLQLYWTANLLIRGGFVGGEVDSEGVHDVSTSYTGKGVIDNRYANRWEQLFYFTLANIQGLGSRICV